MLTIYYTFAYFCCERVCVRVLTAGPTVESRKEESILTTDFAVRKRNFSLQPLVRVYFINKKNQRSTIFGTLFSFCYCHFQITANSRMLTAYLTAVYILVHPASYQRVFASSVQWVVWVLCVKQVSHSLFYN